MLTVPVKVLPALVRRRAPEPEPVLVMAVVPPMEEATLRLAAPSWVKMSSEVPEVRDPPVILCVPPVTASVTSTPPPTISKVAAEETVTLPEVAELKVSELTDFEPVVPV